MTNTNTNTCRLCREWKTDRHTGPMMKYGVRHYAHARCALARWGQAFLEKQPDWVLRQFPFFLAQELDLVPYLRQRLGM